MALAWNSKVDPPDADTNFNGPIRRKELLRLIMRSDLAEDPIEPFRNGDDQTIGKSQGSLFTTGGVIRHFSGRDTGREPDRRRERNRLRAHSRRRSVEKGAADNEQDARDGATVTNKPTAGLHTMDKKGLKVLHRVVIQNSPWRHNRSRPVDSPFLLG